MALHTADSSFVRSMTGCSCLYGNCVFHFHSFNRIYAAKMYSLSFYFLFLCTSHNATSVQTPQVVFFWPMHHVICLSLRLPAKGVKYVILYWLPLHKVCPLMRWLWMETWNQIMPGSNVHVCLFLHFFSSCQGAWTQTWQQSCGQWNCPCKCWSLLPLPSGGMLPSYLLFLPSIQIYLMLWSGPHLITL